jgi:23S rRNA pseudouridine2605 synthase
MSKNNFAQFIKKDDKGAKLKEKIRQEKKKVRKETKEYFAQQKAKFRGRPATDSGIPSHQPSELKRPARKLITKGGQVQQKETSPSVEKASAEMPLNKFVAHAGICSRRDAADLVKSGKVAVNGQVITEPGFKVSPKDEVKVQGKKITTKKDLVYILLNKPKDHITTTDDPQGRKTVMDIVKKATTERVFPVGRLDRNTTGVLILTNDGELAQKLSHPSYEVRKIYEVTLDKPLIKKDFDELLNGITLEDGFIAPDSLAYADSKNKSVIGIEIHSGKNRIVRRLFEKLGYDVRNLDRVMYANLTKKNVERGKWRFLQEKEVRLLKFMNASYSKKK